MINLNSYFTIFSILYISFKVKSTDTSVYIFLKSFKLKVLHSLVSFIDEISYIYRFLDSSLNFKTFLSLKSYNIKLRKD